MRGLAVKSWHAESRLESGECCSRKDSEEVRAGKSETIEAE